MILGLHRRCVVEALQVLGSGGELYWCRQHHEGQHDVAMVITGLINANGTMGTSAYGTEKALHEDVKSCRGTPLMEDAE